MRASYRGLRMTDQIRKTTESLVVAVLAAFGYGEAVGRPLSPAGAAGPLSAHRR